MNYIKPFSLSNLVHSIYLGSSLNISNSGYPWLYPAILGYLWPSLAISGYLLLSQAISGYISF